LNTLKSYVFPNIGKLPVADIDTGLVLKCIEHIWQDRTETANRTRGRIEAVLDWATVRGYRAGDNPARWRGHLSEVLPARGKIQKTKHHPALPIDEVPAFMTVLREQKAVAARALEFTILTAARTAETIGARWQELDLANTTWTIPSGRMKASKEHRVPLSKTVLKILDDVPREKNSP
jgi:integrase